MKRVDLRLVLSAALCMGLLAVPGCRAKGRPDPNIRMAISHEREPGPRAGPQGAAGSEGAPDGVAASGMGGDAPKVPSRLEVPPEVVKAWAGVRLHWKDATKGKEGTLDVPLGGSAPLPDSDLEVRANVFLPAFTMSGDAITSSSIEPENPAARIGVFEKGNPLFEGWVFTRFPDVHPFQHPRFSLRLEGGVRRSS
ncbi:MAG: DUF2155 domain-containing protein [Acidobacteriota bacterium]|nr:DUF2155 domain-containing protein [Acidobacteriota bacterium]